MYGYDNHRACTIVMSVAGTSIGLSLAIAGSFHFFTCQYIATRRGPVNFSSSAMRVSCTRAHRPSTVGRWRIGPAPTSLLRSWTVRGAEAHGLIPVADAPARPMIGI